jgi:RNA polymerase sigma factor (TIGR02999 family)
MSDVTQILQRVEQGDGKAAEELLPLVYEELRKLAAHKLAGELPGQTLQATALVHEAWLRLVRSEEQTWENRGHFFAAAAEAMRRVLVENARRKARLKRGGGRERVELDQLELADTTPDEKVLLINEALEKLEKHDPQKARVVVLKFFGGLTNQEVAANLALTERTVERHWAYAKAWLFRAIREE